MASYSIPVLERAFAVIRCISQHDEGITLTAIVRKLGAPKSTVFKILHTLEHEHVVEKRSDRYFLGSILIHYGLHTLSQRDLKTIAKPFLLDMVEKTGETAHIAVPVGMQSMIFDVVLNTRHIRFSSPVGTLFPLYCTSHGKVFLAFSSSISLDQYLDEIPLLSRTEHTLTDRSELSAELERIRFQGYSMDDIEFADDIRCCAAPVWDSSGNCIAAIGVTSTIMTFGRDRIGEIADCVKSSAMKLSMEMGYRV